MKAKNVWAILTVSALLAGMLTGCGGDKTAEPSADDAGQTASSNAKDIQIWDRTR